MLIYTELIKYFSAPAMRWRIFFTLVGFLWLILAGQGNASGETYPTTRIGVLAYRGPEQALKTWQGHADYLEKRIPGRRFVIVPLNYGEMNEAVKRHEIELLITNTGHYTELEATGETSRIATRLIAGPNGPLNQFGGLAITRANRSDISHYADLKGKHLLIPDKSSLGGWQVHVREAHAAGVDLPQDAASIAETENHEKVVEGVLAGKADVGLVRSDLVEAMIGAGKIKLADIKTIDARQTPGYPYLHSTRLYPEWPLARVGNFSEDLSKIILIALLAMQPDDPAAKSAQLYGWTLPQNYQPVLDLFRETHLGPYANQQISWNDIMAEHGREILAAVGGIVLILTSTVVLLFISRHRLHAQQGSLRLAAGVFEHAREGILITDAKGTIIEANASCSALTGYDRSELLGQTPRLLRSGKHDISFYKALWDKLRDDGLWLGEIWNCRKDGSLYAQLTSISSIRNERGEVSNYIGLLSDITNQKLNQDSLERMAYYDALTGLPNRLLLADRMLQAIARCSRHNSLLAVCYIDLDNFKPINDRWGHSAGDSLLIEVARRLTHCLRQDDTVSRLGGDEFVILIGDLPDIGECNQTLQRVTDALATPFQIENEAASVSASIGVTIYPNDSHDPDTLLRHADQAMYAAKQAGRKRVQYFQTHDSNPTARQDNAQEELERAFRQNDFVLYYQPKVDMRAGRILGAEALIRWCHPERGLLGPDDFLFPIERCGMHAELGRYVLDQALRQMEAWSAIDLHLTISVNIDAHHLQQTDFAQQLQQALQRYPGASPSHLELEIVETAALQDLSQVSERISECRRLGVQFAIDDFGTGYSSLSYLKQLPMQTLKIDRSFVRDMLDDPDDLAIVDGVVGLASAFRRRVIAEGVESVAHGTLLLHLGCDHGQGFGIGRPMPAEDIPGWIARWEFPKAWQEAIRWPPEDLPLLTVEVDHIRWVKEFTALIQAEPGSNLPIPPLDAHQCRFGQWLDSDDFTRYAHLQPFPEIIPIHDQVHRLGAELLNLHARDPQAARARLPELEQLRDTLLARLRSLRRAVVQSDLSPLSVKRPVLEQSG